MEEEGTLADSLERLAKTRREDFPLGARLVDGLARAFLSCETEQLEKLADRLERLCERRDHDEDWSDEEPSCGGGVGITVVGHTKKNPNEPYFRRVEPHGPDIPFVKEGDTLFHIAAL